MAALFFDALMAFEDLLWAYIGAPLILLVGLYFSFKSRFYQLRAFPRAFATFFQLAMTEQKSRVGIHPLKAFFASVGGCIGIGNIVSICAAVQIGGPGALFWVWITALAGVMLKYSEVFLGVKYRTLLPNGSYRGGPMYYLSHAFKGGRAAPLFAALCLCIYGVEVYQFQVMVESISYNFDLPLVLVALVMLALVIAACSGGVGRVGAIASFLIPLFVCSYVLMGLWVLGHHLGELPAILSQVASAAFTGAGAAGGAAGSALLITLSQGVRKGAYSGDVGVGYSAVIHSETSVKSPEKQASLIIIDMFLDTFVVCTMSILLILATGIWNEPLPATLLIQTVLGDYFPYSHVFMPIFLFLLGYSTINSYFVVGLLSAEFISPKYGRKSYYCYAVAALFLFSFAGTEKALSLMAVAGGLLLVLNSIGIFLLRKEISFEQMKVKL